MRVCPRHSNVLWESNRDALSVQHYLVCTSHSGVFMVHPETLELSEISGQRIPVLLYADDLALVATSARGVQAQLDLLHAYADTWGLTVNIQ